MAEQLSYIYEAFDKMSGPLNDMVKATHALEQAVTGLGEKVGGTEKKLSSMMDVLNEGKSLLQLGGWTAVIMGVVSAAEQAISAVMSIGEAIGYAAFQFEKSAVAALSFKENTMASLEVILGSRAEARDLFNTAALFGKFTPFETDTVVKGFKTALAAGFSKEEVPIVFQAAGDVSAMSGFKTDVIDRLMLVFSQIKGAGKLHGQDLLQVINATSEAGVGRMAIFEGIAKHLHVQAKDVDGLMQSGAIDANTAIYSVLEAIKNKTSGGELGHGMAAQADTFSGIMSTLKSSFQDAFLTLQQDVSEMKGWNAFKGALMNVRTMLDQTSDSGGRLQRAIVDAFNNSFESLFGGLNGPDGLAKMEDYFNKLLVVAQDLFAIARIGFSALEGAALGFANEVLGVGDAANNLFDGPMSEERIKLLSRQFQEMGREVGGAIGSVVKWFERLVDIFDSPSFQIGFHALAFATGNMGTIAGFDIAREAGKANRQQDMVNDYWASDVAAKGAENSWAAMRYGIQGRAGPGPEALQGQAGARNQSKMDINLSVTAAHNGGPGSEELMSHAEKGSRDAVRDALESWSVEAGH